jgi:hypothetical protein
LVTKHEMELQEALRVVTEAVKEDTAGNVERAVDLYEQSKGLLEKALIGTSIPFRFYSECI